MTIIKRSTTEQTETCYLCDSPMSVIRALGRFAIGKRSAEVEVERLQCSKCGEVLYTPEQMAAALRAAAEAVRQQEGLLRGDQIRAIREKCGLSQPWFERLLGVGPKTVIRWERGTVLQNRATDELMRIIDAVPAALMFLAEKNNVPLKPHVIAFPVEETWGSFVEFQVPTAMRRGRPSFARRASDVHLRIKDEQVHELSLAPWHFDLVNIPKRALQ